MNFVDFSCLKQAVGVALSLCLLSNLPVLGQVSVETKNRAIQLYNDSVGLFVAGNLDACEGKLAEAYRLDPDNSDILNNYGLVLLKLGRLPLARKMLERSVGVNPRSENAYLNLGLVCEGLGDLPAAKLSLTKFVELTRNAEQAEKMKDHIQIIEKTLASGVPLNTSADDYLGQIERNKMFPWPKERMPIKIHIVPGEQIPGFKASFAADLMAAIDMWARVLEGKASFQKVESPAGADIVIRWANDYKTALMKAEGGDCKYTANGAGMDHAEITILTLDPSPTEKLTDAKVAWVALHEMGHALGINGHSNNPQDVMYFAAPLGRDMPKLSSADEKTFIRLYTEKLPDTWLTLNEEGLKFMRAGKLSDALKKFQAAHEMNPQQAVVKQNLILVEARLSADLIDDGNFKDAEPHLCRALDLDRDSRSPNFDILLKNYALLLERTGRKAEVPGMYKRYDGKTSSTK